MDLKWIILYVILGAIALIGAVAYLYKVKAAKKTLAQAEEARAKGDDREALGLFVKALWLANEKPSLETSILEKIRRLYDRMKIAYDLGDYLKLVEQYRSLSKKSSRKSLKESVEVQKLKRELIEKMPGYVGEPPE
jgi:hypothetical protein